MPILREWRGVIRRSERDAYVSYIHDTGLADYRSTPGNLGALMALNDLDAGRTEVVTLSLWSSWDAIRAFAGDSPELARYYPEDDPGRPPLNRWRSHAHLLFGNWINQVYQTTSFDLDRIGHKPALVMS